MNVASFIVLGVLATGQAKPPDAFTQGYSVARDLTELRKEVRELRAMMKRLLARDKGCADESEEVSQVPVQDLIPDPPPVVVAPVVLASVNTPSKRAVGMVRGRVDTENKTLAWVFVSDLQEPLVVGKVVDIEQRNMRFVPSHDVVQIGTTLRFPNQDKVFHNVFSLSKENVFDLGYYRNTDPAGVHTARAPGVVDIYCNLHASMRSTVLVVPNRHYVRANPDGTYVLNVPAGARTIAAWAPGMVVVEKQIEVPASGHANANFELTARPRIRQTDKFGKPREAY